MKQDKQGTWIMEKVIEFIKKETELTKEDKQKRESFYKANNEYNILRTAIIWLITQQKGIIKLHEKGWNSI